MMFYDVIIIGGGPAGFSAALYASRAKLKILLIERAFAGGQMATTNEMENYPGFEDPVNGYELALRMENQAKRFGTKIIYEDVIDLTLDQDVKTVRTLQNDYQAKVVILCMGASPKELGLANEKSLRGLGVSYCATCDGAFYQDQDVAVIGGGNTAGEDALFLTRFCNKVYLIHRRDRLKATKVIQEAVLNNKKIVLIWNSVVEEIIADSRVLAIKIKDLITEQLAEIKVNGLFVAIGSVPNTGLVSGKVELDRFGYIITDEKMRTKLPGVFAAGDIRAKELRQVITAASDGAIAAYMAEKYISENDGMW
ncbi:MAG TPA: thioredoxin-disulfide reductase [Bacillota bacterium]|jgi:thioredoxin reductase (NADPH)|nr:thioredoxin-disulfide reductase [Bacillota bacterium]HOL11177.1 thioredoxin-disulfide reductase [Bacillota bacterium]